VCVCIQNIKHAYKDYAVSVNFSQDCGNIQKPPCTNILKRENGLDTPMAALTSSYLRMSHLKTDQIIGHAP
jgi:hypothetical protein